MLYIFHGDDTALSRKQFIDLLHTKEGKLFAGKDVKKEQLLQVFEGGSLFGDEKQVFIEDLLTQRKLSKDAEAVLDYISTIEVGDVYLWEGKELTKKQLGLLPKATVKMFKIPQALFQFLDALRPNNTKQMITLFHTVCQQTEVELVFFMLVRQTRILLAVSSQAEIPIDELKRLSPWQKSKLQKQAAMLGTQRLLAFHKKLYAIDYAQKTSSLSIPLKETIDILLVEI